MGLLLAWFCIPVIGNLGPRALPRIQEVSLDSKVLLFALLISTGVGILAGMAPALHACKDDLADVLRAGRQSGSLPARRLRDSLVVGELALALMLLIAAGLLVNSFRQLTAVQLGFEPDDVLALSLSLPESKYGQMSPETSMLYRQVLERIEAIPGVRSAGAGMVNPFRGPRPANQVGREHALQDDPPPMIFLNCETVPWPALTILVKTGLEASALAGPLRQAVWSVDADLPVPSIWPLEQNLNDALA